jgi:HSP20 family protein
MFEGFFDRGTRQVEDGGVWMPATDIQETKDEVVVSVELPGMKKDEIKVTVQDNILTIRGEKNQEKEEKDANYHRIERSYGSFTRSFSLPSAVKADKISATYEAGVLRVMLPKAEEAKPKEIPIAVNGK